VKPPLRSAWPQVRRATRPEELEAMRRRAWMEQGVVTLAPDEVADGWLRQALLSLAVRRWGARPS